MSIDVVRNDTQFIIALAEAAKVEADASVSFALNEVLDEQIRAVGKPINLDQMVDAVSKLSPDTKAVAHVQRRLIENIGFWIEQEAHPQLYLVPGEGIEVPVVLVPTAEIAQLAGDRPQDVAALMADSILYRLDISDKIPPLSNVELERFAAYATIQQFKIENLTAAAAPVEL
jgi:hypothetical protein